MIFRLFKKKPIDLQAFQEQFSANWRARTGADTRPKKLPAWALLMRSPYKSYSEPTSWLGGVPRVPHSFEWPMGDDHLPLHFIAQIDLAALKPEPTSGAPAPGLPSEGALLVFIGQGYAVRLISSHDMATATFATPPEQLADISELGYWGKGPIFSRWPVDPVAYMSYGENRPDFLPDPFAKLEHWITTWGLAALEASLAHKELKLRLQISLECLENKRAKLASGAQPASDMSDSPYGAELKHLAKHAPEVLTALHLWQETAAAQCPADPVDISMLREISAIRSKLAGAMSEDSLEPRRALNGDANAVWSEVLYKLPAAQGRTFFGQEGHEVLSTVAPEFRSFIETYVTDWHHHRLFGLEPEFPNNWETINHQDPLISIGKDQLLGTKSEHDYGFSVWLNDADIAAGIYTGGQFIRHCAV